MFPVFSFRFRSAKALELSEKQAANKTEEKTGIPLFLMTIQHLRALNNRADKNLPDKKGLLFVRFEGGHQSKPDKTMG
jgi:hypothetical protein